MKQTYRNILNYIVKLESKIAFYPTVIGLLGLIFAIFMYYIENLDISAYLLDKAPWLVINNVETARTILAVFVAGLISIMVFSFSMVMILLSQASTNYSPRVLPGLISNRRNQLVLGTYLSCLLYCIFTLIAIEPTGDKYQLPGFSVLLAIVFMTLCLAAFIYFIHSISQGIQISNIILSIFNKANDRLNFLLEYKRDSQVKFPDTFNWKEVISDKSGYIEDIALDDIIDIFKNGEAKAELIAFKGQYVRSGMPLLRYDKKLSDETLEAIKNEFRYSRSELIETNYVLAFKQLTEIAVKAMSPGINDPGTAINAIDYITDLFLLRMQKHDSNIHFDENDEPLIYVHTIKFETILYYVMASLRTYSKNDIVVVKALIEMLNNLILSQNCVDQLYRDAVMFELENLLDDAKEALSNKNDINKLKDRVDEIKDTYTSLIF